MTIQQPFELALQHHQAGRLAEAEAIYRQILAMEPRNADALHLLGVLAHQAGRSEVGVDLIRQAITLAPNRPDLQSNLGEVLRASGRLDEAITAFREAVALKPHEAEAHSNLGNALRARGRFEEAIAACREAIRINSHFVEAHRNFGDVLFVQGKFAEAIEEYRRALEDQPDYAEIHNNLGNAWRRQRRVDEAIGAYRQALHFKPDYAEALNNLGSALQNAGQLDDALACYRDALALRPNDARVHSNLIHGLHFHPGRDAAAMGAERGRWSRQFADPLREFRRAPTNDRDPARRLRVGYVSPNFCDHVVGRNVLPLLERHDRTRFEVVCYANVTAPDALTERFRRASGVWRDIAGASDPDVADLIRADRIDVLIDLTLHMAHHRLGVFARKPAPVQVTFAGYPGSTGLNTIDYRLSDPYLDPPDTDVSIYSEQTVRLPHSFWCYAPLENGDITVNALPAQSNGYLTFGCLNNFCKINDPVLRLWAKVLNAVPASRLLLSAPEGSPRSRTLDVLGREGIAPERIEFISFQPQRKYLELYHRFDVGLDTLPYNGHTTSLDSLWMGVPVVSLIGQTIAGRAGLSQSMNLNLPELTAPTEERYVQIALDLANDLPRLAQLRGTLRERMEQSPLMDAPRFARDIEMAYREMWRKWCLEGKEGETRA